MSYQEILQDCLLIKREQNPSYSLRAFARDLGILSSSLSDVLKGKQGLSKESAEKICERLSFSEKESQKFIDLVLSQHARSKKAKLMAQKRLEQAELLTSDQKKELREDYFKFISEWYYFAVLELLTLDSFKSDPVWISKKLDISLTETINCLDRLIRLGLIEFENGSYLSTSCQLDTSYDIPSTSIKKHNSQILKKAQEAIWNQSVEERELSTLTTAVNIEDLEFVKEEIRKFKHDLDKKLMKRNEQKGANVVYCLSIQFFNLLKENLDENN